MDEFVAATIGILVYLERSYQKAGIGYTECHSFDDVFRNEHECFACVALGCHPDCKPSHNPQQGKGALEETHGMIPSGGAGTICARMGPDEDSPSIHKKIPGERCRCSEEQVSILLLRAKLITRAYPSLGLVPSPVSVTSSGEPRACEWTTLAG